MNLAFTICSANYLPFAKALGDSLLLHNPDYVFKIVLLDDFSVDKAFFLPHEVVPIADMSIDGFEEMNSRYSIFELSCAVKPFCIQYFFENISAANCMVYFDADILVFDSISELNQQLNKYAIVLTPHITQPIATDGFFPKEETLIRSGIYNAGFFAVSRSDEASEFTNWWSQRLQTKCYKNVLEGLFDDQLWLNLVPLLFQKVLVFKHLGYNAAYWNIQERELKWNGQKYNVNDLFPLVFYHYSGYDLNLPEAISKHQDRYSFEDKPQLRLIYQEYVSAVTKNNFESYKSLKPKYGCVPPKKKSVFQKLFE